MANHKSAEKRARQSVKRAAQNHSYISKVRTAMKAFRKAVASKSEGLEPMFSKVQSLLAKAGSRGVMHRNSASRRTKRLYQAWRKSLI